MFQAGPLHPDWSTGHQPGNEIERAAHSYTDWHTQPIQVTGDPFVLPGVSVGNKKHIRLGAAHPVYDVGFFLDDWRTGVGADDFETGVASPQPPASLFCHAGRST